jgi:hypothetical protein
MKNIIAAPSAVGVTMTCPGSNADPADPSIVSPLLDTNTSDRRIGIFEWFLENGEKSGYPEPVLIISSFNQKVMRL